MTSVHAEPLDREATDSPAGRFPSSVPSRNTGAGRRICTFHAIGNAQGTVEATAAGFNRRVGMTQS